MKSPTLAVEQDAAAVELESIKEGTVEGDLHNELMNPESASSDLSKAQKPTSSTDPGKADFSTFEQGNVVATGGTQGDGTTGEKTTTLKLQAAFGLDNFGNQPTQPSKDIGKLTGYD
jgi:hypothetical protein